MAQGEYVAAEKIETIYSESHVVDEILIYGDSLQAYLIAFVFPKKNVIMEWANSQGIEGDFKEVIKKKEVKMMVLEEMNITAKKAKLCGFEIARKLHLIDSNFGDLQLMTTSFKLKRHEAKKYFLKEISEMYMSEI